MLTNIAGSRLFGHSFPSEGGEGELTLTHGEEFMISGSYGTRPNYNVDGYTWDVGEHSHAHMHYRFGDLAAGFPADGSSQATYLAQLKGFFPGELFEFVSDLADREMSIENGGPSQSAKYFRTVSSGFAQGDYLMVQSDSDAGIPSSVGFYTCWKMRGTLGASGKKFRWRQISNGENFLIGTSGVTRENEWPYNSSAFYTNSDDSLSPTTWRREEVVAVVDTDVADYRIDGARPTSGSNPGDLAAFIGEDLVASPVALQFVNAGDSNRNSYFTWHNSLDPGEFMEFADIYLDFTPQRVELWNTAGTIREIQLCLYWDGDILIAVNQGELSTGDVLIKIIDADDTVVDTIEATLS